MFFQLQKPKKICFVTLSETNSPYHGVNNLLYSRKYRTYFVYERRAFMLASHTKPISVLISWQKNITKYQNIYLKFNMQQELLEKYLFLYIIIKMNTSVKKKKKKPYFNRFYFKTKISLKISNQFNIWSVLKRMQVEIYLQIPQV